MVCRHRNSNGSTFVETGKTKYDRKEFICNLCGFVRFANNEEKLLDVFLGPITSTKNKEMYSKHQYVEGAFKVMFKDKVEVLQKLVRKGRSSCPIYVPKEYYDCPVTVIIWRRE